MKSMTLSWTLYTYKRGRNTSLWYHLKVNIHLYNGRCFYLISVYNNRIMANIGDSGSIKLPCHTNYQYTLDVYDKDKLVLTLNSYRIIDNEVEFILDSYHLSDLEPKQYSYYLSHFNNFGERVVEGSYRFVLLKGL